MDKIGSVMVADGGYCGEENSQIASDHQIRLINRMIYLQSFGLVKTKNPWWNAFIISNQLIPIMMNEMSAVLHTFKSVNVKTALIRSNVNQDLQSIMHLRKYPTKR